MQASLQYIRQELRDNYPPEEVESFIRLIFSWLKSYSLSDLILKKDDQLSNDDREKIIDIVARLKRHEPIQYIFGEADFYDLTFQVSEHVLIPRPETEELVDWIIKDRPHAGTRIMDAGTGSGCIPVALKKNLPEAIVSACDISAHALAIAHKNAEQNQAEVYFFEMDILSSTQTSLDHQIDILVSNPPYIRLSEKELMHANVLDFEPHHALFVENEQPLLFYEALARFAQTNLVPGGLIYWEINEAFGKECCELLHQFGFTDIILRKDLNGKDRMVKGRLIESKMSTGN
ncbi:peptide chain release factor N(5)-glutamine methyltransferase [Mangrovibacterium marinum]|uniref:Release factor glutamine methyltransferase n=1 Tax=Mangrovibacterium marinum TaxID=1639118 RepID=A0A2T5C174_9BACT|nr:peptide chain release factor N(5)-glutamine methyltransferase [Mangrovibacterium marinum]PTN08350.1 release factor glutamine methyltransferase [Mangrovibacterium marinum]